jgi:hypothetical protein
MWTEGWKPSILGRDRLLAPGAPYKDLFWTTQENPGQDISTVQRIFCIVTMTVTPFNFFLINFLFESHNALQLATMEAPKHWIMFQTKSLRRDFKKMLRNIIKKNFLYAKVEKCNIPFYEYTPQINSSFVVDDIWILYNPYFDNFFSKFFDKVFQCLEFPC